MRKHINTTLDEFVNESRKISKSNMDKFQKSVKKLLSENGFQHSEKFKHPSLDRWTKESDKFGELEVSISTDDDSSIYTIFMRFNNIDKFEFAKKLANNKYSGKRNIHNSSMDDAIEQFKDFLKELNEA